jgi:hypothetical protein
VSVKCTSVDGNAKSLQEHVEKYLEQGWRIEHYSTSAVSAETAQGTHIKFDSQPYLAEGMKRYDRLRRNGRP